MTNERYVDEATLTPVVVERKLPRKPGEQQRYVDEYGAVWRYFAATRSVTYLRRVRDE